MTVPLTSTVSLPSTSAADSNACTGTTLPINLSHRECRLFQTWRLTQSQHTGLERRQLGQTNHLLLAAVDPAPPATPTEPWPLSP